MWLQRMEKLYHYELLFLCFVLVFFFLSLCFSSEVRFFSP